MTAGLREQKKEQTRAAIAQAARDLFARYGYAGVTVDDVAVAAGVTKKTVFNHFPTKEDLVFHRSADRIADLQAAVTDRADGVSLLESFRQLWLRQLDRIEPLQRDLQEGRSGFHALVHSDPALERRFLQINAEHLAVLTTAIADDVGAAADDPLPAVLAATLLGAQRTLFRTLRDRIARGESDPAIRRAHRRAVEAVFDRLGKGFADYS